MTKLVTLPLEGGRGRMLRQAQQPHSVIARNEAIYSFSGLLHCVRNDERNAIPLRRDKRKPIPLRRGQGEDASTGSTSSLTAGSATSNLKPQT